MKKELLPLIAVTVVGVLHITVSLTPIVRRSIAPAPEPNPLTEVTKDPGLLKICNEDGIAVENCTLSSAVWSTSDRISRGELTLTP